MSTELHAFVDGDSGRCGAIVRLVQPRAMRTRTVFRMGAGAPLYLVDHLVEHDGDVRRWTRATHDAAGSHHTAERGPDGKVRVDGGPAPWLAGAVGGYGEHLLLTRLLSGGGDAVSFLQYDEGEPDAQPEAAELRRAGTEPTELLDGSVVDAERVQLHVAGRPGNAHWHVDGVVVKSDWCGAQSFLVDDFDALCAGLDDEVTARIRESAAGTAD